MGGKNIHFSQSNFPHFLRRPKTFPSRPFVQFYCLRQCTLKRGRQSANQSVSQASSQSDRTTQFGFFVSGRCGPKQWGELLAQRKQWPNGNAPDRTLFGRRFEPRSGKHGGGAADNRRRTGIWTADLKLCSQLRYHSTGV